VRPSSASAIGSLLAAAALLWAGCEGGDTGRGAGPEVLLGAQTREDLWVHYGRNYAGWRYAPIDRIDRENVGRLELLWKLDVRDGAAGRLASEAFETTALYFDGLLYVTTVDNHLLCLDPETGETLWRYSGEPEDRSGGRYLGTVNRGAAIGGRHVCLGTGRGRLTCFDYETGLQLWDRHVADARVGGRITSAPLVVGDKILIGASGAEFGVRGFIDAYRIETGERAWRFWVVPGPGEPGNETWEGDSWRHGGGTAWVTGTYDPELDLVYYGTGNPAPDFYGDDREGSNLYTNSIVALDPDDGALVWHFQTTPHDLFDWSGVSEPVLVDEVIDGEHVPALFQVNRNGYLYVLDRRDGRLLRATPYTRVDWARIDADGRPRIRPELAARRSKHVCPGQVGGKNWPPAAYSPRTHLVYIPEIVRCQTFVAAASSPRYRPGLPYLGGMVYMDAAPAEGSIRAVDVRTGAVRWSVDAHGPNWGGTLATAGGLVFGGSFDGRLRAFHDETGEVLWSFPVETGVYAPPTTFVHAGRQYLGWAVGFGVMGNSTSGRPARPFGFDYYMFRLPE
jgi:alcohol dehydrogenase (cytochrome c)